MNRGDAIMYALMVGLILTQAGRVILNGYENDQIVITFVALTVIIQRATGGFQ